MNGPLDCINWHFVLYLLPNLSGTYRRFEWCDWRLHSHKRWVIRFIVQHFGRVVAQGETNQALAEAIAKWKTLQFTMDAAETELRKLKVGFNSIDCTFIQLTVFLIQLDESRSVKYGCNERTVTGKQRSL